MSKRERMLPKELEEMMNEARMLNNIIEVGERMIVSDKMEEARSKHDGREKAIISINPLLIHVPNWQRELRVSIAKKIGSEFNPYKWDLPKVVLRDGKFYVIDGMHRIIGAYFGNMKLVQVEVLIGITEADAVDLFLSQQNDRKRMTFADTYSAALVLRKEEYVILKSICDRNHVAIKGDRNPVDNPIGVLTSLSDGVKMAKLCPDLLDRILKLIVNLQWNGGKSYRDGKAFSAKVIRVFRKLYAYYSGRETDMERVLLNNCKGSKYFNDNLSEKWQDSLFDFLSDVIEKNIDIPVIEAKTTTRKRTTRKAVAKIA
jgi:hypothetical protein